MQGIVEFEEIQHSMGLAFSATRTKNLIHMIETPLLLGSLLVDLREHKGAATTTTSKTNKKKAHKTPVILQNLLKRIKIHNNLTNQLKKRTIIAIPARKHHQQLKTRIHRLQTTRQKFLNNKTKSKLHQLSS